MINLSMVPIILSKTNLIVDAYARLCGVAFALWTKNYEIGNVAKIDWLMVLDNANNVLGLISKNSPPIEYRVGDYVEQYHPLYKKVADIQQALVNIPDSVKAEDLKKLNSIWYQISVLEKDPSIKDSVSKNLVKYLEELNKFQAQAPNSQSVYIPPSGVSAPPIKPQTLEEILEEADAWNKKARKILTS